MFQSCSSVRCSSSFCCKSDSAIFWFGHCPGARKFACCAGSGVCSGERVSSCRTTKKSAWIFIYNAVPDRVRRVFKIVTSVILVLLLLISLPASWDYVTFMKRERTASLHIPINYLYSIYMIFSVACIIRHCRLAWGAARGTLPQTQPAKDSDMT